jgi:hypothetical protein
MNQCLAVYLDCSHPSRMYPPDTFPEILAAELSQADLAKKAAPNSEGHAGR